jgi:HEAT repeat protein
LLMSLCASTDHEVVKAAARALKGYPAHRATAALLGLLSHERWDVRWASAEVLSERGDVTALGPLQRARKLEQDALVKQVLGQAIDRLRDLDGEQTAPSAAHAGPSSANAGSSAAKPSSPTSRDTSKA